MKGGRINHIEQTYLPLKHGTPEGISGLAQLCSTTRHHQTDCERKCTISPTTSIVTVHSLTLFATDVVYGHFDIRVNYCVLVLPDYHGFWHVDC